MSKFSIILLVIILFSCFGLVSGENEIHIGAIIADNGESASYAKGIEAAIDLAISDLNDSFKNAGINTTTIVTKVFVNGTKEGAFNGAEELSAQGVEVIVGPYTSEEVVGILPVLNEKNILSVSSSTSVELSKPGDPVIRLAPSDAHLYKSLVAFNTLTSDSNPMKGIILARNDVYGGTLSDLMKSKSFVAPLQDNNVEKNSLNGNVTETLLYSPQIRDFSKILNELDTLVTPLIEEYGEKNVVILTISFDEISDILAQASQYPNLYKVRWQGTDSIALNPAILMNETAARFAADTEFTAFSFNIIQPEGTDYWRVYDVVKEAGDGHKPSIYEILPYDQTLMAAWIMQSKPSTLDEMLFIADSYGKLSYGATGWLKLNTRGDRQFGDYFFYQIMKNADGTYSWIPVSMFLDESNTLVPLTDTDNIFMKQYGDVEVTK
ncbi:ABC transporter substrate-binding protein [Methanospirillum sp. J.3.6.1-F.2.7.3]|uniref:ABC transporter substrate-binding protein n=1 Tax=Methanospirillum purgamenti TaxID=2834276 RepID=A0A8E7B4D9_9EURY|nr:MULTISPECIES: ABC transporter substrate-binding protein [Methanospirillum]MDX8551588.1 ABC transporter substrate-binding protein [Methanospirillum hungatei]QVV90216.1 ABC transporter substrate-binding protein [Methanospirillum sp. J.3.6.1-F.2.7.3]